MNLPPAGPFCVPIDCSNRQLIEPVFGQLASEPAAIDPTPFAHTTLLSSELCHVALPKGRGFGAFSLGLVSGLRKVGDNLEILPENLGKKSGFGASVVDSPRSTGAHGQANVALSTQCVAYHK